MVVEKVISTTGKWLNGKWVREAVEAVTETTSKGRWVNGKWVKEATQVVEETAPKSKALVNFTTKPATTPLESGRVYTKMKPALTTDVFEGGKLTIPTTKLEGAEAERFIEALKTSNYAKIPKMPSIPSNIDFSNAEVVNGFKRIRVKNDKGMVIKEYISKDGKNIDIIVDNDIILVSPKGKPPVLAANDKLITFYDWGQHIVVDHSNGRLGISLLKTGDIVQVINRSLDNVSTVIFSLV